MPGIGERAIYELRFMGRPPLLALPPAPLTGADKTFSTPSRRGQDVACLGT